MFQKLSTCGILGLALRFLGNSWCFIFTTGNLHLLDSALRGILTIRYHEEIKAIFVQHEVWISEPHMMLNLFFIGCKWTIVNFSDILNINWENETDFFLKGKIMKCLHCMLSSKSLQIIKRVLSILKVPQHRLSLGVPYSELYFQVVSCIHGLDT